MGRTSSNAKSTAWTEHRYSKRAKVRASVIINDSHHVGSAELVDLSHGGALLKAETGYSLGARLRLVFKSEFLVRPVQVVAKVVRTGPSLIGISFVKGSPYLLAIIDGSIQQTLRLMRLEPNEPKASDENAAKRRPSPTWMRRRLGISRYR